MSWTRLNNDPCAYRKDLRQSTSSLDYIFDRNRYVNCQPCRVELGTFGGRNTGGSLSTLVDVESDLLNINRKLSNCPERKYLPDCDGCNGNSSENCVHNTKIPHLPSCNLYEHTPRVTTTGYKITYPGCAFKDGATTPANPPYFNPIKTTNVSQLDIQNVDAKPKHWW